MDKLDMASISFSSFHFGFSFKCNSVTGYRLIEWDLFEKWCQWRVQFKTIWEFQTKIKRIPMDLAPGLPRYLLPRREDNIPSWSELLALNLFLSELVLLPSKFEVFMGDWVGFQSFLIKLFGGWQRKEVKGILEIIFSQMGQRILLIFEWNLKNGFYKDFILFIFKN